MRDVPESPPEQTIQLLERALAGDRESEHALFGALRDVLVREARSHPLALRLAPAMTAEDLADEALLRALASDALRRFEDRERGALRRFLCRILDNAAVDALRRATSLKRGATDGARPLSETTADRVVAGGSGPRTEAYVAELRALCESELDDRDSAVWHLATEGGLTPSEIAARLGITAASARGILFRVRRKLGALLDTSAL